MSKKVICNICRSSNLTEEQGIAHSLNCGAPEGDKNLDYWRFIVKELFFKVLKQISEGVYNAKWASVEENRAFFLIISLGLIKSEGELKEVTPEAAQFAFIKYAPNAIIAGMEYAKLLKQNEDGTWSKGEN